uniref:Uncharacterized protein n=1 Tax=Oryzias sinensis TaxID=183150 RepID=A0A8C7WZG3_9TELE
TLGGIQGRFGGGGGHAVVLSAVAIVPRQLQEAERLCPCECHCVALPAALLRLLSAAAVCVCVESPALLSSLHLLDVSPAPAAEWIQSIIRSASNVDFSTFRIIYTTKTFWLFTCFGLKLSSFSRKSINRVVLSPCFQVTQATNQIVMNCADIDIITASFAAHGGDELNATGFNYQNEDEKVTLSFPSALQKGRRGFSRRVCL